jgi:folate-binding protein YgfZ
MKPEWKSFLQDAGAEMAADLDMVESFGNAERERRMAVGGEVICDLSHYGLISVHGEDALMFLQGQFTNDVRKVSPEHSQISGHCNAKGRLLASFRLFMRNDTYYLRLPREMVEPTLKRLRMYLLRAKASLEDASEGLVGIGLSGPSADQEIANALGSAPTEVDHVIQSEGITIIRLPGTCARFEIWGELEPMQNLWNQLNVRAAPVGAGPWALLNILAGIPCIHPETAEAFVPQQLNMQLINGVSFTKGCYTGQEVVARTQYLGKIKRRMYLARVETDHAPQTGDELFASHSKSGQGPGRIVNVQRHPDGDYALLAVMDVATVEGGDVHIGNENGPVLTLEELPYSFEEEEQSGS